MPKYFVVLLAVATVVFGAATAATANNDPHRVFFPASSFDIPAGVCAFPVHVDVTTNKEYATISTLPNGSTKYVITGAFDITLTNSSTGKSLAVNASGPETFIVPASGTIISVHVSGSSAAYITNGAAFGLPNMPLTSGPFDYTTDTSSDTIVTVTRAPHVRADLCASLT